MASKPPNLNHKIANARDAALRALLSIEVENAYSNLALNHYLKLSSLAVREKRLATELVYGTLRWQQTLDTILVPRVKQNYQKLDPWVRCLLRLGSYQLLFLARIPASAVCNESTALAHAYGHQGTSKLVNAVLRGISRDLAMPADSSLKPNLDFSVDAGRSHPAWLVDRWKRRFGETSAARICAHNNTPAPLWLRTNTLKVTANEFCEHLADRNFAVARSVLVEEAVLLSRSENPQQLPGYALGWFSVQDVGAMLAAHILAPVSEELVIDACAGLGGKTIHLAQLMKNRGQLLAVDIHQHKIHMLELAAARMGVSCIKTITGDARELPALIGSPADKILLDVPCSGTGVLRRRPEIRWRQTETAMLSMQALQSSLLNAALASLKPGGVLVYCTCSLEFEENEAIIDPFIKQGVVNYDDFSDALPNTSWNDHYRIQMRSGRMHLLPPDYNTDGFFFARLIKQ